MSASEIAEFSGYLFACWLTGFVMGWIITAYKKFLEQV